MYQETQSKLSSVARRHIDTSEWQTFPVPTIVSFVYRECLHERGGDIVIQLIDSFLDTPFDSLTLSKGYKCSGGSLRLLQYLAAHESTTMDPFLRRWEVNIVASQMATRGDLQGLEWIAQSHLPSEVLVEVVAQASANGHLGIVQWLWEHHRGMGCWGGIELCKAIANRQFWLVEWLKTHVALQDACEQLTVNAAAAYGNLEIVQWLCESFNVALDSAVKTAALHNEWDIVQWILDNGRSSDLDAALRCDSIYTSAARSGNLKMLERLFDRDLPSDPVLVFEHAISGGHLHIVKWLHEEKGLTNAGTGYIKAAQSGQLDMLKYLFEKKVPAPPCLFPINAAAEAGLLEIVQWLHWHTITECTKQAMDRAASRGHLHMVQWLHTNRAEGCSRLAMDGAAEHGHLSVVKWLHENRNEGCSDRTMVRAAMNGHLDVVVWLSETRQETFDLVGILDRVAACGRLKVLQWLHVNGYGAGRGCTRKAMDAAAFNGDLDMVKWLHVHRSEGCSKQAMDGAATQGHLKVVKWLHANRSEGCSTVAIDRAAMNNQLEVVKWLHRHRSLQCTRRAITRLFRKSRDFATAVYLFSEFPNCHTFQLRPVCGFARLEMVEWLLERVPGALHGCSLVVKSWNSHLCNYLENNGWKQTRKLGDLSTWIQK